MYDFAVVGAGMAGASLAAELAEHASVLLLEAEHAPGYHATGRSAAFWDECYGGPEIVPLTLASGSYLRDQGFLETRGALYIGHDADGPALDEFLCEFRAAGSTIERVGAATLARRLPGLRSDWTGAVWEPGCADIDVAALHAHYLRSGRHRGVSLRTDTRIVAAVRQGAEWRLASQRGESFRAAFVVNAAGAWADDLAELCGARAIGIRPLRRTMVQLRTDPTPPADLPLVLDISDSFYFKPEAGRLWLSPHDEELSPPCDAAPEDIAVARAVDRFQQVMDWRVEAVERRWAGLRSFAPDRRPVYGADPSTAGFIWFAGQGGFGIQTAPAAARLASQLVLGRERDAMTEELDASLYAPERFA